jgi:hypothetical protein
MAQDWMAQDNLWQMIQLDNTFTDGEPVLAAFAAKAANSRYKWISDIANAIMTGDRSTANALLAMDIHTYINTSTDIATGVVMRDGTDADYIVTNYITLFNTYLKYGDSTMTGDDSAKVTGMANLCPYTNGNVVYMAQAMYRILFADDTTQFDGNCGNDTTGARGVNTDANSGVGSQQKYLLYPNPNDGSFVIKQTIANTSPVSVSIKDVFGREVYSKDIQFMGSTSQLTTANLSSGVYMLQITDTDQKISNFKFVIQK